MRFNRNANTEYTNHITIIIELIQNNNEAGLWTFLESHPYLNLAAIDEEQRTVFHWAAEQPNTQLFEILLQFLKIDCPLDFLILQKDIHGNTPWMIAITQGHGDIIKRIDAIQKKPAFNWKKEVNQIRIPSFTTSLDIAFNKGHLEKSIAALKACTKLEDIIPTIVLWAIQNTQLDVIKTCWESLAKLEAQIEIIIAAITAEQHEVIVFLHTHYPNHFTPFLDGYTPARAGNIETFHSITFNK